MILFAFGSFTGVSVLLSAGAFCGGGSQGAISCSLPWPDPRLSIAFLLIGAALLIAGTGYGWGRRHGGVTAPVLSIAFLVLGSGSLELGISTFAVYVFSSSWMFYLSLAELGVGIFLLVLGTRHWWRLERRLF